MNNNEQIQQYRYGNYVNALEIYAKKNGIENPIMDDTILLFVMQDILKMCGWVDDYLHTHTKPDGENYYNRQEVINTNNL